jgi:hypothetical protein
MTIPDLDLRTTRAIESIATAVDRIAAALERQNDVADARALRGTSVDSHLDRGRRAS